MSKLDSLESLLSFTATMEVAVSLSEVSDSVRKICAQMGYDRFALFSMSANQNDPINRIYWVEGDWFGSGEVLDAKTYMQRCPATLHVITVREPFFWTKAQHGERCDLYRIVTVPRGPGIHGLQVPLYGPTGLEGAMSLGGTHIDSSARGRLAAKIIANAAFSAARRLTAIPLESALRTLSVREREVLAWTAAGRRQSHIAVTLGLSERTVENHLRRIRKKLDVRTTTEAVRVAIRNGEIDE